MFEIVIDGLTLEAVSEAMARGLEAAAGSGASHVTAGNYGGDLGPYHIALKDLVAEGRTSADADAARAADRAAGDRGPQPRSSRDVRRDEVEALTVWHGNRRAQVGDFFAVSGRPARTCASRATCAASSSSVQA